MQKTQCSPPTVVLALRLRHESLGNDQSEWRGAIKNLSSGEARYFRQWEEISTLVPKMLDDQGEKPP